MKYSLRASHDDPSLKILRQKRAFDKDAFAQNYLFSFLFL